MYKARTGYRNDVDARMKQLEAENWQLKRENQELKDRLEALMHSIVPEQ